MNEQGIESGEIFDKIVNLSLEWGPKVAGAIIVLIIGLWFANIIAKSIGKILVKREISPSLIPFIKGFTGMLLKVLVVISVMGMIGIQMTSFIAILGAMGLAVGLALSGTLQNFAGGVIILILRPFNVGDFIEAQGYMGTVKEISIFNTILNTVDNKVIILPNGSLSSGSLTNFSIEPLRRVDWKFGIAYGDDMENFKKAINDFIAEDTRILKEPESFMGLSEFGESSVNFVVRSWVNAPDYWGVFFEMNEKVYKKFGNYNLNIPFPQMDVHLKNQIS